MYVKRTRIRIFLVSLTIYAYTPPSAILSLIWRSSMILPIENNAPTLIRRVPILLFFLILILSAPAPNGYAAAIPSDLRAIHVLNRLAFGPSPGDLEHVKSVGVDNYIDDKL